MSLYENGEWTTDINALAHAIADMAVMLEDSGHDQDCGPLHGMSGEIQNGGCSWCETLEAYRTQRKLEDSMHED